MMEDMRMGDITDFRNFVGAVIDEKAFKKISEYLDDARSQRDDRRRRRGRRATRATSSSRRSSRRRIPGYRLLCEEIFGPVVTAYVYDDDKWDETLEVDRHDVAVRAHRRGVRQRSRARCARR